MDVSTFGVSINNIIKCVLYFKLSRYFTIWKTLKKLCHFGKSNPERSSDRTSKFFRFTEVTQFYKYLSRSRDFTQFWILHTDGFQSICCTSNWIETLLSNEHIKIVPTRRIEPWTFLWWTPEFQFLVLTQFFKSLSRSKSCA